MKRRFSSTSSSCSSSRRSRYVTFADRAVVYNVDPVPSLVASPKDVWYSSSDYRDRKHVDNVLIRGVYMGTVPIDKVCMRGLEARMASYVLKTMTVVVPKMGDSNDGDNNKAEGGPTTTSPALAGSSKKRRSDALHAVLTEQHRQRETGLIDEEEIANVGRNMSERSAAEALERGLNDQSQIILDDGLPFASALAAADVADASAAAAALVAPSPADHRSEMREDDPCHTKCDGIVFSSSEEDETLTDSTTRSTTDDDSDSSSSYSSSSSSSAVRHQAKSSRTKRFPRDIRDFVLRQTTGRLMRRR